MPSNKIMPLAISSTSKTLENSISSLLSPRAIVEVVTTGSQPSILETHRKRSGTQHKRAPSTSVLDKVIESCNEEVNSFVESSNSLHGGNSALVHATATNESHGTLETVQGNDHSFLSNNDEVPLQQQCLSNAESRATVKLNALRQRVLGRILGKMQRLEAD